MSKNSLWKSGFLLFFGLFIGRILGLIREFVLANHFGVSSMADMTIALITLPDIIINIFVGNAAAAVFIPKIQGKSNSVKLKYFIRLSLVFGAVFSVICILIGLNAATVAELILPSQSGSDLFLTQLRYTLAAIPFLALNSISRLFLQNENKFFLIGFENIVFNTCIILAILLTKTPEALPIITLGIVLGAALRWVVQVAKVLHLYREHITTDNSEPIHVQRQDFSLFSQAISASLLVQLVPLCARSLSSYVSGAGGLSLFNYVYKFSEFPVTLGISVASSVLFPKLAQLYSDNALELHAYIKKIQSWMLAIFLPLTVISPLVLIFSIPYLKPYAFAEKLHLDSLINYLALCVSFISVRAFNEFYIIVLNARKDVTTPLRSTFKASCISLGAIFLLSKWYGMMGAFVGLNIFYVFNLLFNLYSVKKIFKLSAPLTSH